MTSDKHNRICPVERAGGLDTGIRRWVQNPRRILRPHVRPGMTALDMGCGPGFFTLELARLVGPVGRVIAADLQDGMLRKLQAKIRGTELEVRITLHQCRAETIGLDDRLDFALAFYLVHELPDPEGFFRELHALLRPGGRALLVEPPLHVSRSDFEMTLRQARAAGFNQLARPRVFLGRTALLTSR